MTSAAASSSSSDAAGRALPRGRRVTTSWNRTSEDVLLVKLSYRFGR